MTASEKKPLEAGRVARLQGLLIGQLRQGLSPARLALALAMGAVIGIMPTIWGTSVLCLIAAHLLRLNQVVTQAANYLVYPLQVACFVPFFRLGQLLFGKAPFDLTLAGLKERLQGDFWNGWSMLLESNLKALGGWLLLAPLLLALFYGGGLRLCRRLNSSDAVPE